MKKVLCFALILLLLALSACGKAELPEVQPETKDVEEQIESTQDAETVSNIEEQAPTRAEFNFETKTVMLNSGYEMPINGIGTYSLHDDECVNAVKTALSNGVRLIDTASAYGNEEEVGQAIREAIEEGIILRWNLQKGVVVIPGSSNLEHIKENTELYHFSLTDEEMAQINELDRGEKHDWY